MNSKTQILRIDASANASTSNSKKLGDLLIEKLETEYQGVEVKQRDLNRDLYFNRRILGGCQFHST